MSKTSSYAVIMAGGVGARFWPMSRKKKPKQLLALVRSDETLLQATVRRVSSVVDSNHILIVTSETMEKDVQLQCPSLPLANILSEPVGRNTAACIGWAATHIARRDPNAVMTILPSDHYIQDERAYEATLRACMKVAEKGFLVTVGIEPSRPETGYGYIEVGKPIDDSAFQVKRFIEKPSIDRAKEFLQSKSFLWNSGMFFFRADAILNAFAEHLPQLSEKLAVYGSAENEAKERELVRTTYVELPSISIDHGVMEKASRVAVVPASFGWSDLGSWTSAWELAEKDAKQNSVPPDSVVIESQGCYVNVPKGKVVALVGVEDLVVVDTDDALLVLRRDQAQHVKEVMAQLTKRGDHERV